ncbi:MAG: hypothetical protein ACP5E3_19930 [Bacteroidales bacterium]
MDPEKKKKADKLYRSLRSVIFSKLMKYGSSFEEAREIYHDSFIIYMKRLEAGNKKIYDDASYVIRICFILLGRLKKEKGMFEEVSHDMDSFMNPEKDGLSDEDWERFFRCLKLLSKKCQELIHYKLKKYDWDIIAKRMKLKDGKKASDDGRYCFRLLRDQMALERIKIKNRNNNSTAL